MGRMRAGAYLRAAWIALLLGGLGGWAVGVAGMLAIGEDVTLLDAIARGGFSAPFGVGIGVVGGGVAVLTAALLPHRAMRLAIATAAAGLVVGLVFLVLIRVIAPMGWTAAATAAVAAVVQGAAAEHDLRVRARGVAVVPPPAGAVVAIVAGMAMALLSAFSITNLLRQVLRYGCSLSTTGDGDPSTTGDVGDAWRCVDGIGYLGAGMSVLGPVAFLALLGLSLAFGTWRPPIRSAALVAIALAPLVWVGASTFLGIRAAEAEGLDRWATGVAPSLLLATAGVAVIAAVRGAHPRVRTWTLGIGLLLVGAAVVAQPGLLPVLAVSAGLGLGARLMVPPAPGGDLPLPGAAPGPTAD